MLVGEHDGCCLGWSCQNYGTINLEMLVGAPNATWVKYVKTIMNYLFIYLFILFYIFYNDYPVPTER